MASSARAAGADVVLAAAAIRQLASRDAHCSREMLLRLVGDELSNSDGNAAIDWLVAQRFLLSFNDLRCPHQRLAIVLWHVFSTDRQPKSVRKLQLCSEQF